MFYFVILTLEKLTGFSKKLGFFSHIYTLLLVIIGWVVFRAKDIASAVSYLGDMFGFGSLPLVDGTTKFYLSNYSFFIALGIVFCFPIIRTVKKKTNTDKPIYTLIYGIVLIVFFLISVTYTVKGTYNPFIYFNF